MDTCIVPPTTEKFALRCGDNDFLVFVDQQWKHTQVEPDVAWDSIEDIFKGRCPPDAILFSGPDHVIWAVDKKYNTFPLGKDIWAGNRSRLRTRGYHDRYTGPR